VYSILTPSDAVVTAAAFLQRDWSYGCAIATTPHSFRIDSGNENYVWFVFECGHTDGSRWLIAATRYGQTCHCATVNIEDLKPAAQAASDENERRLAELGGS
jgi:hypothetical protein